MQKEKPKSVIVSHVDLRLRHHVLSPVKELFEIDGLTVVLSLGYGDDFSSIGFVLDDKTEKAVRTYSKTVLQVLNKIYDDLPAIENAFLWHINSAQIAFAQFDGTREEYLDFCKTELENEYLTPEGQEAVERMIKVLEKKIQDDILAKLKRKEFAVLRRKHIAQLLENAGYKCQECENRENLTVDHIVPITRGGTNDVSNFQILCRSCNASKGNNLPDERKSKKSKA